MFKHRADFTIIRCLCIELHYCKTSCWLNSLFSYTSGVEYRTHTKELTCKKRIKIVTVCKTEVPVRTHSLLHSFLVRRICYRYCYSSFCLCEERSGSRRIRDSVVGMGLRAGYSRVVVRLLAWGKRFFLLWLWCLASRCVLRNNRHYYRMSALHYCCYYY